MKSIKLTTAIVACSTFITIMQSIDTHAVSINNTSPFQPFVPASGSSWYTIKGTDGNDYDVPYIMRFNNFGAGVSRYNYYASKGTNQFFRQEYGESITYQPIPTAPITGTQNYSWNNLYESVSRAGNGDKSYRNAFWRTNSVQLNTVYCGQRENANPVGFHCVSNSGTGIVGGGHKNLNAGIRSDGTFGGTGSWGEARFIGYSGIGNVVDNTYFPMDSPLNYSAASYPYANNIFSKGVVRTKWDIKDNTTFYNQKKKAVQDLINQEKLPTNSCKLDCWMERLSLLNNPLTEAPVFKALRGDGKTGYQVLTLEADATVNMNLAITKVELRDDKSVLQGMTRAPGSDNVSYSPKELNKLTEGDTYKLIVEVTNDSSKTMHNDSCYIEVNRVEYSTSGKVSQGGKCSFEIDYSAPSGVTETNIEIKISDKHNEYDNFDRVDDYATLKVNIEAGPKGDLNFKNIYLVDVKKSTASKLHYVDYPIQGVEYLAIYELEYSGDSMRGAEFNIEVDSMINTFKTTATGSISSNSFKDYSNSNKKTLPSKPVTLDKSGSSSPQKIYIQGGTFTATTSKIEVSATIKIGDFKWEFNENKKNDSSFRSFYEPINLKIHSLKLNPGTHPGGDYCGAFVVDYEVDFFWKGQNGKDQEVQTIKVDILVAEPESSSFSILKTETVKVYANRKNQQYSAKIEGNCVTEGSTIKVVINSDYALDESNISDNYKTSIWKALSNRADYCAQSSAKNTQINWTQRYAVLERQEGGYSNIVDILTGAEDAIDISNNESYEIKAIWMNSKLMRDKKFGSGHPEGAGSGWVDALNSARGEEVVIKSGYGFTMQIEVRYKTNAYLNEDTHASLTDLPSNKDIYNRLEDLPLNDNLYLKTSDDKVISLTSTDIKFVKSEIGDKNELLITYELDSRLSPNGTGEMVDGLFINEETPDGTYEFNFYTAPLYGVPGKTTGEILAENPGTYRPLCDNHKISFRVNGSYRDDLNVNIIK